MVTKYAAHPVAQATLYETSLAIILANQADSGAFVASPAFSQYGYSWFRDGAFIALSLDSTGRPPAIAASSRFHAWVVAVMERYAETARRAIIKTQAGEPLDPIHDVLHCRYSVDGALSTDEWVPFQIDGFGTWLFTFAAHCQALDTPNRVLEVRQAAPALALLVEYLTALWAVPNYDCWEEHGDKIATATLAAIYGGLQAIPALAAMLPDDSRLAAAAERATRTASAIKTYILAHAVSFDPETRESYLTKFCGGADAGILTGAVDASLLWVAAPYGLLSVDDPIMKATIVRIIHDLVPGGKPDGTGGVHRYAHDSYYGGGEWLLLTAWLGIALCAQGQRTQAVALRDWIAQHARNDGALPEQVIGHLNQPYRYSHWLAEWGEIATPLIWSHASYISLVEALARPRQ